MNRLIVGAGRHHVKSPGDITLDIKAFEGIDLVVDLNGDWDLPKDTYDEIIAIHVVEHLDSLIHFMDSAWYVLKPGGILHIETPLAGANTELEWADPTHKRCYTTYSFHNYFTDHGVAQFGYTDRVWQVLKLHTEPINPKLGLHPDVVVFRGTPIK